MKKFLGVQDIGNLHDAVAEALEVKRNRFAYKHLGQDKTLLMIFFNNSLRTRLSTQKAAMNLGMNVMVLDVNQGAWKLETERGVVMDGDKSEHLLEAIPVMGSFCDLIGLLGMKAKRMIILRRFSSSLSVTVVNLFLVWSQLQFIRFRHLPI